MKLELRTVILGFDCLKMSFNILHSILHYLLIFYIWCGVSDAANLKYNRKISHNENEPLVKTKTGAVLGQYKKILNTQIASFMGIPFAKPPLGNRRFLKPEPIDEWSDVLIARDKPPACMQYSSRHFNWIPSNLNKSEDCLYLNVWTPAKLGTESKLPVLVWIYGGGFFAGASALDLYDGSVLSASGDVVVVSMNYRVGSFGFLNAGIMEAPGNAGLHDQLLALKWTNENIRDFGGDPNRITIFGESAGSVSVGLHLFSPLSRGLFQSAILQSGSLLYRQLMEDSDSAIERTSSFSEIVGCSNSTVSIKSNPADVVNCLKQKNALEIAEMENFFTSKFPIYFLPSYGKDNEFLPDSPFTLLNSDEQINVPILIGGVENESTLVFLHFVFPDIFPVDEEPEITLAQAKFLIRQLFSEITKASIEKITQFYFHNLKENDSGAIVEAISNALSDFFFTCPSAYFAERVNKAYFYWMTHRSQKDTNAKWVGVAHVSDVNYVFGEPMVKIEKFTDEDRKFSADMIKKWVTFSRKQYPLNEDEDEKWSTFKTSRPLVYELNPKKEGIISFPRKSACEFWRPYILSL